MSPMMGRNILNRKIYKRSGNLNNNGKKEVFSGHYELIYYKFLIRLEIAQHSTRCHCEGA